MLGESWPEIISVFDFTEKPIGRVVTHYLCCQEWRDDDNIDNTAVSGLSFKSKLPSCILN